MKIRDHSIDFLRGVSILLVILTHLTFFPFQNNEYRDLWIIQSIPIFIFMSGYMLSKKIKYPIHICNTYFSIKNIQSMIVGVLVPAIVVAIFQYIVFRPNLGDFARQGFLLGPGSYYILVYLQVFLLVPIFSLMCRNKRLIVQIFFVVFLEIICYVLPMEEWVYRLFAGRYLLILFLGIVLQNKNTNNENFNIFIVKLFTKNVWLFYISILFSVVVIVSKVYLLDIPIFPKLWKWHFYLNYGCTLFFIFLLMLTYNVLQKVGLSVVFEILGKYSLVIYFIHMTLTLTQTTPINNLIYSIMPAFIIHLIAIQKKTLIKID